MMVVFDELVGVSAAQRESRIRFLDIATSMPIPPRS